jgi:hypothetical protein
MDILLISTALTIFFVGLLIFNLSKDKPIYVSEEEENREMFWDFVVPIGAIFFTNVAALAIYLIQKI